MGYEAARELAWDLRPAVDSLARLASITYQKASDMLLEVFDALPLPPEVRN